MARYIQVETENGTVFMEVDETAQVQSRRGYTQVGPMQTATERFNEAVTVLSKEANKIVHKLRQIDGIPDEIEVSFGIKAAGEIGSPIFALATGSLEASYSVTLKWKRNEKASTNTEEGTQS